MTSSKSPTRFARSALPGFIVAAVLTGGAGLFCGAPPATAAATAAATATITAHDVGTPVTWLPAHPGDFADPSVMLFRGTYFGFATQNFSSATRTINIQESISSNGTTWTPSSTDALPDLPSWARAGNTWSPTVAYDAANQLFVMYYTVTQASNGYQCISQAIASSPLGPYVDQTSGPVICQDGSDNGSQDYGGSIDPDIFTDNGVSTLIWKSDGNRAGVDSYIWSQPLSANLLSLEGNATAILADDQPWQDGIIEGPDMVDYSGVDYLFYSGNYEGSSTYAIGYAVCSQGPAAPCADSASNPIMTSTSGLSGPGGPSAFLSPTGQLQMAFSAWEGTTVGYFDCGLRPMYVADLNFNGGVPSISPAIGGGTITNPTCASPPSEPGYWQVAADGGVFTFGSAKFYGSTGDLRLNEPVVGMAATPDRQGYWLVASDGGVFSFGDAAFFGSTGGIRLNRPIIGMVPTFDGRGYWLVASDGGIFAFGDAQFYGSTGGISLSNPVTAMAPSFLGGGYWLVDANGQVFSFGNAADYGEPPYAPGGYRITGMAGTANSNGYWLVSANGNVAAFGNAKNYGSPVGTSLNASVVGLITTSDAGGYWLQASDGGIFSYGDAVFEGSMGGHRLNAPMVGIASANP